MNYEGGGFAPALVKIRMIEIKRSVFYLIFTRGRAVMLSSFFETYFLKIRRE
jgi:hypothetical protein